MRYYVVKVWQENEWHNVEFRFDCAVDATQFACSLMNASQLGAPITVEIRTSDEEEKGGNE